MKERDRHRLLTGASRAPEPLCPPFPSHPANRVREPPCLYRSLPLPSSPSLHGHRQLHGRIQIADTGCYYALHIYPANFTATRLPAILWGIYSLKDIVWQYIPAALRPSRLYVEQRIGGDGRSRGIRRWFLSLRGSTEVAVLKSSEAYPFSHSLSPSLSSLHF